MFRDQDQILILSDQEQSNSTMHENDEEWHLFYCDSTLGCRVIQDFALCKLDDL